MLPPMNLGIGILLGVLPPHATWRPARAPSCSGFRIDVNIVRAGQLALEIWCAAINLSRLHNGSSGSYPFPTSPKRDPCVPATVPFHHTVIRPPDRHVEQWTAPDAEERI